MTREFNNPPDEQPDDSFLQALSENLGKLNGTPIDEIFQGRDTEELEKVTREAGELTNEDYSGWDENPVIAVNKADVWDFQEKFDGPAREYNEDERDITLSFFTSAKDLGFQANSDHVRSVLGEPTLELTYPISDNSEFLTRISENSSDLTPIISITHRESGVSRESSTYIVDEDTGLVHRHDETHDPDREELRARFRSLFENRETASQEEIESTAHEILESFANHGEVHDDEVQLGVNGRPVGSSEVMRLLNIIRDSTPRQ